MEDADVKKVNYRFADTCKNCKYNVSTEEEALDEGFVFCEKNGWWSAFDGICDSYKKIGT